MLNCNWNKTEIKVSNSEASPITSTTLMNQNSPRAYEAYTNSLNVKKYSKSSSSRVCIRFWHSGSVLFTYVDTVFRAIRFITEVVLIFSPPSHDSSLELFGRRRRRLISVQAVVCVWNAVTTTAAIETMNKFVFSSLPLLLLKISHEFVFNSTL